MHWMKMSALAVVVTIGFSMPATVQAQSGSATAATDSLLTAEQLMHYIAVKRALNSYWREHQELFQAAQSAAKNITVTTPGGQVPVRVFDYPALVKQDTALATIFSSSELAPGQFTLTQVGVYRALGFLASHAVQGTALPAPATVNGKNIQLVHQYLLELAAVRVAPPPAPVSMCKNGNVTSVLRGAAATSSGTVPSMVGIPALPDDVTVIPFYTKPHETDLEKTKVVIEAEIDGHRGVFIFDLGAWNATLNRTFLQPNAKGGVDTVTDANRIPDNIPWFDYVNGPERERQLEHVRVSVKLGSLVSNYDDSALTAFLQEKDPHRYNAELGHLWGNFGWVFAPRMGNLGPAVFEPFETIVDYTHRRIVLIRLDAAGHRVIDVPAYTQTMAVPLPTVLEGPAYQAFGIAVGPCDSLDTSDPTRNLWIKMLDTGAPDNDENVLGYQFLSGLGVFGINLRTHQFMLYRS